MYQRNNKIVGGVVSAIAVKAGVSVLLMRILFLAFLFGSFGLTFGLSLPWVLVIYIICAVIIRNKENKKHEKLKTLTELYEKSLITKEEFEQKKSEILNSN